MPSDEARPWARNPNPRPWEQIPPGRALPSRRALLVVLGPPAVWAAATAMGMALAPTTRPDRDGCEWGDLGCSLSPSDALLATGLVLGVVVVPGAIAVLAILALVDDRGRRHLPEIGLALFALLTMVGATLAIAVTQ